MNDRSNKLTLQNIAASVAATVAVMLAVTTLAAPALAAPALARTQAVTTLAAPMAAATVQSKIVSYAKAIERGHREPGWPGGRVPYSWGGGHGAHPRPSLGTCAGYTGSIKPCPANHTKGVDCSGFTRWVYYLAFGRDVLGSGSSRSQINRHMHRVKNPQPGDLVFYGGSARSIHHVGIYIGHGKMIDALRTGTYVKTDSVHLMSDLFGYYHYR
ncbi:MAG: Cell wall-associated hydrolase (invasion-associated protein)-like protein [Frankiales bacterium]|nr:Cell wall-associated hydrolase (invasion-associated protein)-like protein [Frankiales bacterium]